MKQTLLTAIAVIAMNVAAVAQEQPIANKEFQITVSGTELQQIFSALGERPLKDVATLWDKLNKQVKAQLPEPAEDRGKGTEAPKP